MSLVRAERRRLLKRRFTRYMLLVAVLILAAVALGTYFTNEKVGPAQIAAAQRQADRQYELMLVQVEQERQECQRAKEAGVAQPERYPQDCEQIQAPSKEQAANPEWFMPATFDFKQEFQVTLVVFTAILALVAFVVGASYMGAEWSTGGMMNLLLWRPRRLQVLTTKLGTLVAWLVAAFVLLVMAWTAAFWTIATYRGTTAKMTPGTWESFALTGARGLALVLVAGVLGFAAASLGRHTAMALGGALAVIVVGQFGLGIVLGIAQVRFLEMYLLPTYVAAWMFKSVQLQHFESCQFTMGECRPETMDLTWRHSALLFGITTLVVVSLAMWSMRRRDIT
jgi:ABC-2 type transport system permease protein